MTEYQTIEKNKGMNVPLFYLCTISDSKQEQTNKTLYLLVLLKVMLANVAVEIRTSCSNWL